MTEKLIWLVAGNKGNVGKSVMAKAMVEWILNRGERVIVADGDAETCDVAETFKGEVDVVERFDLSTASGWGQYADWVCSLDPDDQIVTNLPDGVTEKTLIALERYKPTVDAFGFTTRALFVMNTLPDGLRLLPSLLKTVRHVYPVKNLYFGQSRDFAHFDQKYARHFPASTIFLPRLYGPVMNQIRIDGLSYAQVLDAGEKPSQSMYSKMELSNWLDRMLAALDEVLTDEELSNV
jgi:hypothetical protein